MMGDREWFVYYRYDALEHAPDWVQEFRSRMTDDEEIEKARGSDYWRITLYRRTVAYRIVRDGEKFRVQKYTNRRVDGDAQIADKAIEAFNLCV